MLKLVIQAHVRGAHGAAETLDLENPDCDENADNGHEQSDDAKADVLAMTNTFDAGFKPDQGALYPAYTFLKSSDLHHLGIMGFWFARRKIGRDSGQALIPPLMGWEPIASARMPCAAAR